MKEQDADTDILLFYDTDENALVPSYVVAQISGCPHLPQLAGKATFIFFDDDWQEIAHKFARGFFEEIQAELLAKDSDECLRKEFLDRSR
jgi:hypothetical protein